MKSMPLPLTPRFITWTLATFFAVLLGLAWGFDPKSWWIGVGFAIALFLTLVGFFDYYQTKHAILRNYPIAAHLRFIFEAIRPEMRQYFFEGEKDGLPFPRDRRAIVYQRAKMMLDVRPFGTNYEVYSEGYEWMTHSISPTPVSKEPFRIVIGGPDCTQPYSASIFNISAMSFGALSANAIRALNGGAKLGGFAHDTGEGGYSPYHREGGGDIIWEIGSGYFGARNADGTFSAEKFAAGAANPQVKMVELKLSQGAKPGHGGVLPAPKVSEEIALTRGVPVGEDCISPSHHTAFSTPIEMMQFIAEMRRLSGGKPAGFKLCVGHEWEFMAICKAMLETGIYPDFIVVDGKEGGTGAAPMEFLDHVGKPMRQGLHIVHNAMVGIGARHRIKIGVAGKIITAFDIIRAMALGADWCNSARGFMFAVGCIQSQSCHTDRCPTGVATQDPTRQRALVVPDKMERVVNFHRATLHELAELTAAAGLDHPTDFKPVHISRRVSSSEVKTFADLFPALEEGELVSGTSNPRWRKAWDMAHANSFRATA
ncbi:FMN-binding glutamate synthase family protein [Reyranella sp. MMS21-HV4-11]|uniref:FMN-binding glutamate synthase family protein n=1 Tax=Reyranella humidisoli TaxID=2849149 RepID=A0ABS6IGY7_9HYPH|nr:FMN-binding glutamate synthase family protein [Reyranella sp. MMS21-HV4-11]MBU8873730.1 FMN-binding glutamate synthase family protein [Reyranella sp. MMS21-HV4-11]